MDMYVHGGFEAFVEVTKIPNAEICNIGVLVACWE